jgi:hypothetical protein
MELRFDGIGMWMAALPFHFGNLGFSSRNKTFCSRYITGLLQDAGIGGESVKRLNPHITTPSKLHKVLTSQQRVGVVGTVPFKQASLFGKNSGSGYEMLSQGPQRHQQQNQRSIFSI